ncbi:actin-like ATPase domain-containing protein [Backusella circina FSU 941]|nr:actin-like ATPase domain-containing protein [Backusella circina FSU 941]
MFNVTSSKPMLLKIISYSKTPLYEEVQSIEVWPGDSKRATGVYSSFLYNTTTKESFWGYEAYEKSTNAEDEVYISHIFDVFKNNKYESRELIIFYLSKFIEGVVNYAFEKMKASYLSDGQVKESTYFIVTCPDESETRCPQFKELMKEAFKVAGLIEKDDEIEQCLDFIDNSAAVGYHCLRQAAYNQNPEMHLKPGKNYLVYNINNSVGISAIFAESPEVSVTVSSIVDEDIKSLGSQEILHALKESSRPEYFLDDLSEDLFNDLRFYADIDASAREYFYLLRRSFHEHYYTYGFRVVKFRQPRPVNQKLKKIVDRLVDSVSRVRQKLKDIPIENIYLYGGFGQNRTLLETLRTRYKAATPVYNYEHAASIGAVAFGKSKIQSLIFPRMDTGQVLQSTAISAQVTGEEDVNETSIGQPIDSIDKESNISEVSSNKGDSVSAEQDDEEKKSSVNEGEGKGKDKGPRYFIGIDFGTTYSGAAFALEGSKSVTDIKNWPNQRGNNYPKAPTVILYNDKCEYIDRWGEGAKRLYTSPRNQYAMIRNFKLLLTEKIQEPDQAKLFKPMQLIPEYLESFHAHIMKEINSAVKDLDPNNITYCFTVPSMWGEMSKQIFVDAIIQSGIINRDDIDERLRLISEPEAAALYCEQSFQDQFQMSKGQRFLICDAGGGTVDVVTFEVNQKTNKKYIAERTGGDGKNCGSIALDLNFEEYIMNVFRKNNIPLIASAIEELVQKFVTEVKPNFNYAHDPANFSIEFALPSSLQISTDTLENTELFEDEILCIPYEDMCRFIFDPVVNQTVDLIAQHLEKLPEESRQVDAMLLVGGFGQSTYLLHKVQERFLNKYTQFVGVPPEGEMAVARGAVYFCLNPEMVNHRPSRHTYGLGFNDVPEDKSKIVEKGFNGKDTIALRFLPFAERKVSIFEDLVKERKVYFNYPCHGEIHIFSSNTDTAPQYVTHAKQLWVLPLDFTKIQGKKKGEKVQITITMRIGRTLTSVEVTGKDIDRPISKVLVDYSPGRIADVAQSDAKVAKFVIQKGVIREI